jgi:hypothetical protein
MKKILATISVFFITLSLPIIVFGVEDSQSVSFDIYFSVNSEESIGTDDFIYVYYSKDIPDAYMDVFVVNAGNYSAFVSHQAHTRYPLGLQTDPSGQGTFLPPYEDVWYVVFHNVDAPLERSITVSYKIEFDERFPTQNDGNIGDDAGDSIDYSTLLDPADYNSSGMLIFTDYFDWYKFYAAENDTLTLSVSGLYDANCNFELYEPLGFDLSYSQVNVSSDILINQLINKTGFWIMKFSKTSTIFTERENYTFEIVIDSPETTPPTTPTSPAKVPLKTVISIIATTFVVLVVYRKKVKIK